MSKRPKSQLQPPPSNKSQNQLKKTAPSWLKGIHHLFRFCGSSRSSLIITGEILIGLIGCIGSLVIFIRIASEVLEKETALLDQQISLFVYGLRTPFLTQIMLFITNFGSQFVLIFAAMIAILFLIKHHRKEAVLFTIAVAMGAVLDVILKSLVGRPRPTMSPLVIENSFSFPSGHAMFSFIFYALVAYFSFHFFRNRKFTLVVSTLCLSIVLLVGLSRIYLGVHYFTDVIAGYIAGFWWFMTILLVEHTMIFYRLFRKAE